jgi:hypothetical protein
MTRRLVTILLMLLLAVLIFGCPKKNDDKNPAAPQLSITITSPNGGESWQVGSSHNITWTDNGVTNVAIDYSVNSGTTWTSLVAEATNTHTYSWTIPNSIAATCKVRVKDASDANIGDESNAVFSIIAAAETDVASGTVSSEATTQTVIETPAGARIVVPPGAIPRFEDGSAATQTFSIERTTQTPTGIPSGETLAGAVYQFGPDGFNFAAPVEITIPVTGVPDSTPVYLYRIDPTTQLPRRASAVYDPTTHTIHANTYGFSPWFPTFGGYDETAAGCVHVTNLSNKWLAMCAVPITLTYPTQLDWVGTGSGLWGPLGNIGVTNQSDFHLPQGTYQVCLQWESDIDRYHYFHYLDTLVIGSAYNYWWHPQCSTDLTFTGGIASSDTGRCICAPTPSYPVHTGAVQVTLTWYVPDTYGRDLDLHVFEPSGEEIYYAHARYPDSSATGGQLDQDVTCGDYHNGQENIFWTDNPPVGEYIVKVRFFGPCSSGDQTLWNYGVRTVVLGNTRTYTGQVTPYETVEVARFSIAGANVEYRPPVDAPVLITGEPPKSGN